MKEKVKLANEIYAKLNGWNIANGTLSEYFNGELINEGKINVILTKVCLIDSLYKTSLKNQISVANHILSIKDLDKKLKEGGVGLVIEISKWKDPTTKKIRNLISFASKFCHFHNKKAFPIYDSHASRALSKF